MSEQEYTIEKCGGLNVYHPVGSQYPDLQQRAEAMVIPLPPEYVEKWNEMVKRTDLPLAA